jgi:hypothetical protein
MAETIELGPGVPMSDLLGGEELLVGDKLFTDFTYAFTGDNPPPENVNVIPILEILPTEQNYGIRFQGGFIDLGTNGASDVLITYTVHVTDPSRSIVDVHLAANTNIGPGTGFAGVTETFLPTFPDLIIEAFDLEPGPTQLVDWADLPHPVQWLPVQKDIILLAAERDSVAQLSFVDQTFSQVPEPGAVALLAAALSVLLFTRRVDRTSAFPG